MYGVNLKDTTTTADSTLLGRVNFTLEYATKVQNGRSIALLFL